MKSSARMVRQLKQFVTKIVVEIPVVSDYYYYYWYFPRYSTSCRGVFNTFSEALQALPPGSPTDFNQPGIHDHLSASDLEKFNTIDYPIVLWLKSAFADSSSVFDLGGSVGGSYYAYRKYLQYPDNLSWVVCDLPENVKAGNKLAREANSPGLSFTVDFADAEGADILLTCGTLQYLEVSLREILEQLHKKPKHILINQVPFYEGESFVTLQSIVVAICPYKIQNRADFLKSLTSIGYELIDSWEINRTCYIPFHPERAVSVYYGFYLRLNKNINRRDDECINAKFG